MTLHSMKGHSMTTEQARQTVNTWEAKRTGLHAEAIAVQDAIAEHTEKLGQAMADGENTDRLLKAIGEMETRKRGLELAQGIAQKNLDAAIAELAHAEDEERRERVRSIRDTLDTEGRELRRTLQEAGESVNRIGTLIREAKKILPDDPLSLERSPLGTWASVTEHIFPVAHILQRMGQACYPESLRGDA